MSIDLSKFDSKKHILIKGASLHNLKNIDVAIPRNKFVVITGLSGSGKSSLAFDTLYAEGQRRYVESLSSYARQFLGKLNKPKVEYIKGISPAIAIEQKVNSTNPRSTVGTTTEIYDYLKILFARIGITYSPTSNNIVKKHSVTDVVSFVKSLELKSKLLLLSEVEVENDLKKRLNLLLQQGFSRVFHDNTTFRIDEFDSSNFKKDKPFYIVVDRIITKEDDDFYARLSDAVQIAFYEGKGSCLIYNLKDDSSETFSNKFELDGLEFIEPSVNLFSFNNPFGACPSCEGYGDIVGLDPELVIPNTSLSVYENAIAPWKGETLSWYKNQLINNAHLFDFPVHRPFYQLTTKEQKLVWNGNKHFVGLNEFFEDLESKSYKIQNRVLLSKYRGKTTCSSCNGKRLREEANYVKINNKSISDLVDLPISDLASFFKNIELSNHDKDVSKRLLIEINSRIEFLQDVGLGYLTLNRKSNTLSGGESQRINLATSLGSSLVGSMYILDEPSIGLHSNDTFKLIKVLKKLKDLGNTVIVVEHDEDIMNAADEIIDIGPEAGVNGGNVMATGTLREIKKNKKSLTAQYLNNSNLIEIPQKRRKSSQFITIEGARENNLKDVTANFPLKCLTAVTGVSGSGKSTLIKQILYPLLAKEINRTYDKPGKYTSLTGDYKNLSSIEFVDQNPIGKSSRSNPVTYLKAYDEIRNLYSKTTLSKLRNYKPKHFSFNTDGGRCETCKGTGEVIVEMQFMADVHLTCETCKGKKFKKDILEVKFEGKNINDILELTIDEAIDFFDKHNEEKITKKLKPLQEVGLGYVTLGQKSSTLSGGEAQRIKLAYFLSKGKTNSNTLFIFDEPTTGLHFHDIKKLLKSFEALIKQGNSIIVVEHNLDLVKCADFVVDLGPYGGEKGGQIIAEGTPEDIAKNSNSLTGKYLKEKL